MKTEYLHHLYFSLLVCVATMVLSSCASAPKKSAKGKESINTSKIQSNGNKGMTIAQIAEAMVGVDYRYGGSNPEQGFDCSGLVFYSHTQVGEQVPRVSYAQLAASDEVSEGNLQPGDLLFYRINGKPSHVGIYIGHGRFVHAPSSGKKVSVSSIENVYFKPRFIRAGRLYNDDDQ